MIKELNKEGEIKKLTNELEMNLDFLNQDNVYFIASEVYDFEYVDKSGYVQKLKGKCITYVYNDLDSFRKTITDRVRHGSSVFVNRITIVDGKINAHIKFVVMR